MILFPTAILLYCPIDASSHRNMSSYAAQKGLLFAALLAALLTVRPSSFHTSVYNTEIDFLDDLLGKVCPRLR